MPPKALPVVREHCLQLDVCEYSQYACCLLSQNKVPSFKPVTLAGRNSDGKAKAQGLNSSSSAGPSSQAEEAAQLQQLVAELEAHMRYVPANFLLNRLFAYHRQLGAGEQANMPECCLTYPPEVRTPTK